MFVVVTAILAIAAPVYFIVGATRAAIVLALVGSIAAVAGAASFDVARRRIRRHVIGHNFSVCPWCLGVRNEDDNPVCETCDLPCDDPRAVWERGFLRIPIVLERVDQGLPRVPWIVRIASMGLMLGIVLLFFVLHVASNPNSAGFSSFIMYFAQPLVLVPMALFAACLLVLLVSMTRFRAKVVGADFLVCPRCLESLDQVDETVAHCPNCEETHGIPELRATWMQFLLRKQD